MNREAGRFFHQTLYSGQFPQGLEYLHRRGLTDHTIKLFGLGYAPDDYHYLHKYLKSLGYSDFDMFDGSLLAANGNKMYDKFRDRVMFPIFDTRGNIAAFGGRTLKKDDRTPKYLNSGETIAFNKRNMLFALNKAKNSKADYFILCEGYMDVISLHQAGFDSAVASLGTSLTEQQTNLIARLNKKSVVLSYDSDTAGQTAASRAINMFSAVGIHARVLRVEGAKDPDEFIKKYGAAAFKELIDFQMSKLSDGLDINSDDGKSELLRRSVPFLSGIGNDIDRAVYISKVAKNTGIPAETITGIVNREMRRSKRREYSAQQSAAIRGTFDKINPDSRKFPKEERAERGIICFLYHNPDRLGWLSERLTGEFLTVFNKKVFEFVKKLIQSGIEPDISLFNEEFEPSEMGRITEMISDGKFADNLDVVGDFVKVINESAAPAQKDPREMTAEDLLNIVQKTKESRK